MFVFKVLYVGETSAHSCGQSRSKNLLLRFQLNLLHYVYGDRVSINLYNLDDKEHLRKSLCFSTTLHSNKQVCNKLSYLLVLLFLSEQIQLSVNRISPKENQISGADSFRLPLIDIHLKLYDSQ